MENNRIEHDALGELAVPADAYWGIHTQRALANFAFSGRKVNTGLIKTLAVVKKACCQANAEIGFFDARKADAIIAACGEIMDGQLSDQFPVDALQGGAGTSANMNMNEVIANRAIEILGGVRGDYSVVHPIEDVNLHQSTNDVFPTAVKCAAIKRFRDLSAAAAQVQGAFQRKEKEFAGIVKMGRTELQEAVPITLGAEFGSFSEAFARDRWRTFKCEERLRLVNIGGTAVGTGLTAPRQYIFLVIEKLRELSGAGLARGEHVLDQTANSDCFVEVSGMLKAHACNLIKICNDMRLLNMLGEIALPALQTGSSIMPGKVNPVMCEAAMQVGMRVCANDTLVADACARATLQINEFMPIIAHALLESLDLLCAVDAKLAEHIGGITADAAVCAAYVARSKGIVTALVPHIGYDRGQQLLAEFAASGRTDLRAFLVEKLGAALVDKALSPYTLTALGFDQKI